MVNLCKVVALATVFFVSTVVSHADVKLSPRELATEAERIQQVRRGLDVCAKSLWERGWDAKNAKRRAARAASLRAKRNLPTSPWKSTKRDFADVLKTNHNDTLKFPGANLDSPSSVFFGEDPSQACVLAASTVLGPFYVDGELVRNNIVDDQLGVPLYLDVRVLDIETCEPIPEMYTDIWHTNSTGVYSGVSSAENGNGAIVDNLNTTFSRGIYPTDGEGVVEYQTIFPGHYSGRAIHIHVLTHEAGEVLPNKTFRSTRTSHIGQIYFDQALIDAVGVTEPYASNHVKETLNADDFLMKFSANAAKADPVAHYIYLGDHVNDGIFAWTTLAVNRSASVYIHATTHWTKNGGVNNTEPRLQPDMPAGYETETPGGNSSTNGTVNGTLIEYPSMSPAGLNFTPYLLQLGLTKSRTSLVWIVGPLSGLIVQPLIGVITDRSTSKWGRRRPFMVGGSLVVGFFLLVLGWAPNLVGMFISAEDTRESVTIAVAVISIYAVDFSINVVQASCRSLIVDTLPIPQQQLGSAWASRMTAVGHLLGYAVCSVDMLAIFGHTMGDTQFKQITVIAAALLIFAVSVTSYAVKERVLISVRDSDKKIGVGKMLAQFFRTTVNLPPRIRAICWAQFWAWIGWFPFLFYSTTWVGETYFRYEAPKEAVENSSDTLGDVGRIGSMSLVIFSLITFISSVLLPFVVLSPDTKRSTPARRPPLGIIRLFNKISFARPDLQTAWMISHIVFFITMIFAPAARSVQSTTLLVAICGIPWAVSCWAPFAFMGVEINRLTIPSFSRKSSVTMITSATFNRQNSALINYDAELEDREPSLLRLNHSSNPDLDSDSDTDDDEEGSSTGELAGVYLGVLNVFSTLPQFVGTFISWIVFSIFESGASSMAADGATKPATGEQNTSGWINRNHEGPNAIAVCLFIGAISALVAAEGTRRLKYIR
ncbi:hypothetical protein GX48_05797 [Paracoccidioides brasiliensis]|nr:hypothetical protein GX48_05797 [Paracoccidioides brasiliensis]